MPTLEWIGKSKVINHHQNVPFRVLERKYSFDENGQHDEDNGSENMIIRGDNLEALKALLPRYEGRIKCIYIDPPYNTGNEGWVYNDNVNDPKIKKWLGEVVGKEGEDLTRHDKWLCMMYPRLKLLQKLLAEDGVIFISIDDTEISNLRLLMDEVFGVNNFVTTVIWHKNYAPKSSAKFFSEDHDYITVYAKNKMTWMLDAAAEVEKAYTDAIQQTSNDPMMDNLPWEVRDKVKSFGVNPQFREDIETLQIPQFFLKVEQSLFTDGSFELLDKEMLAEGFTLKGKAYDIDFAAADDEIREIDVREQDGGLPKVFKMESAEQRYFKEWFNNLPPESRVRQCKEMMFNQLNKLNMVDAAELKAYINRIVDDMDKAQLAAMEKAPLGYAAKIRDKIETLLETHYRETFDKWLETERIVCKPYFRLRPSIHPATYTDIYARSLYAAEDGDMNKLEQKLIVELTALPNVRWWHRNIAKQDFAINGFIKHYPDILIMTQSGKLICAETKGEHLKNDDSREKIALGQAWSSLTGSRFRYYMVFQEENNILKGAVSMRRFVEIVAAL